MNEKVKTSKNKQKKKGFYSFRKRLSSRDTAGFGTQAGGPCSVCSPSDGLSSRAGLPSPPQLANPSSSRQENQVKAAIHVRVRGSAGRRPHVQPRLSSFHQKPIRIHECCTSQLFCLSGHLGEKGWGGGCSFWLVSSSSSYLSGPQTRRREVRRREDGYSRRCLVRTRTGRRQKAAL